MIQDLKELEKFFKICRKQGVMDIVVQGVSVKFGEMPAKAESSTEDNEEIPTDALSPEQMMFYAVENAGQT